MVIGDCVFGIPCPARSLEIQLKARLLPDAQSYRLYVAFNRGKDTQGLVQVDVKSVEPGKTAEWTAEAPLKGEGLKCVLRVERFAPQD